MPSIPIHPPSARAAIPNHASEGLPPLLQTPSGLALVEIQGSINSSITSENPSSPLPVGKLVFPHYDASAPADDTSWQKRVYLYVGKYQRLTGEVKKLPKAVAVLKRRDGGEVGEGEALEVVEIVRWKIWFGGRPEPVGGEGAGEG